MNYIEAVFVKENSNRFSAVVKLGENIISCYLPYSSKLGKELKPEGKKVFLLPINGKRFAYKIVAIIDNDKTYYIDLNKVNDLFEKFIYTKYFYKFSREKKISNNYRSDFNNTDAKQVLEVKTLLSSQANAIYPSVNPIRFIKQLKEISVLIREGYSVILVLILLNKNIRQISFNYKYSEFSKLFFRLLNIGCELHIHEIVYMDNDFVISEEKLFNIEYKNKLITINPT